MTNIQDLFDEQSNLHGNFYKKHSEERRANISAGAVKRWANTSVRYTDIAGAARRKPVMTPQGVFPSRISAAKALDITDQKLDSWMKRYPDQYYYINQE
jgi:hypothetical protein